MNDNLPRQAPERAAKFALKAVFCQALDSNSSKRVASAPISFCGSSVWALVNA
jgi:hypothetical protein